MKESVFISYSHKDTDISAYIAKVIEETCDKNVWVDSKLRGGENYFSVIAN